MNILVISRGIPSRRDAQWGGIEFDQAKALASIGHNVIVASVDLRFRFYWRKLGLTTREQDGIKTYNMFYCPYALTRLLGHRFSEKITCLQWQKIIAAVQRDMPEINIVYTHYLLNTYYAVKCFANTNIPIVALEHWSALNREPIAREVSRMANYAYPRLSKLLTVSVPLKARLKEKFSITPVVVHNMVGKEFFYTASPQTQPFTFISVGSLFPVKNHRLLITALTQINLPKECWQLIIVGEGKERIPLQAQIAREGLTKNIHLVGLKNREEIAQLLNEGHVFVLPSKSENFSVAVLEALACGMPVVASLCGGIRECIDEKNGMLFKVDDVNGLAHCLQHMYDHYADYDRQVISVNCLARFSQEVIAQQLTKIFEENT